MNRNQIEAFTARWLASICSGNVAEFADLVAPQTLDTLTGRVVTRAAFQERAQAVFEAFEALEGRVDELLVDGLRIAWRWTLSGRQRAPFLGEQNRGRLISLKGVNLQRLEAGVVAEHFTLLDVRGALAQLRRGSSVV
ncbi:MAG: ester cyclase [Polyangiaceae bacterium]